MRKIQEGTKPLIRRRFDVNVTSLSNLRGNTKGRINTKQVHQLQRYEFLVSKETVVLRRWERSKQKFGFIKRVDKGSITTVKDLES